MQSASPRLRLCGWVGLMWMCACCRGAIRGEEINLIVAPMTSSAAPSVSITVTAGALGSAADSSAISGNIRLELLPSAVAPETARITEMRLVVDEEISLRLLGGVLHASTQPQGIQLDLTVAGDTGTLTDDRFDQQLNLVEIAGLVSVSLQPEPIDLADFNPIAVDFLGVAVSRVGREVTLQNLLTVVVETQVDTGLLGVVPFTLDVAGGVTASGLIPAGRAQWRPEVGQPGDGRRWSDQANWLRDQIQDTGPIEGDAVHFPPLAPSQTVVDLEGERRVGMTLVAGRYALTGGSLDVQNAKLDVEADGALAMEAHLVATGEINKRGAGDLLIFGESTALRVSDGRVGGHGQVEQLTVEGSATLLGLLDYPYDLPQPPLRVVGTASLHGAFQVAPSVIGMDELYRDPAARGERHTLVLLEAGDVTANLTSVWYGHRELSQETDGVFVLHEGNGLFRSVLVAPDRIQAENYLALPGDANGDGDVDFGDFLALSAAFGGPGNWTRGDFDGTESVDFADFLSLSATFGMVVATAIAIPEPDSAFLVVVCLILIRQCRGGN